MKSVWLAVVSLGCGMTLASAQCCPGPVTGHVRDEHGAPIANAEVKIDRCSEPYDRSREESAVTNADGSYVIEHPSAGPCSLTVTHAGFKTYDFRQERGEYFRSKMDATYALDVTLAAGDRTRATQAQASPVTDAAAHANWNFGALVQSGFGVTEDRNSFKFLLIGGHAGRVLTPVVGSGWLKGDFEYGVEVFPLWQSYTPKFQRVNCTQIFPPAVPPGTYVSCSGEYTTGGTYTGVSITPIILRWNFTHGERWMPWIQGAGGVVWTNHKYPAVGMPLPAPGPTGIVLLNGQDYLDNDGPNADTSVWNFTPQFGIGTHYFVRPRRSIDVSANAVHISSASLGDKNPGVNASVQLSIGYSWWK